MTTSVSAYWQSSDSLKKTNSLKAVPACTKAVITTNLFVIDHNHVEPVLIKILFSIQVHCIVNVRLCIIS